MTVFDLHLHTVHGSSDSNLHPEQLIEEANRIGLDGICLTEHSGGWENYQLIETFKDSGLVVIGAVEVYTDVGHVIAIGIRHYVSGMHTAEGLRKVLDKAGGVMIPAHPFRNFFNRPPYNVSLLYKNYDGDLPTTAAEAATHPLFALADDIEIANGSNTDKENLFTLEVARELGFTGTGGSDAHSTNGVGKCVTIFDGDIRNEADMIEAIKAKAFTAGQGMHVGNLEPFGERSVQEAAV